MLCSSLVGHTCSYLGSWGKSPSIFGLQGSKDGSLVVLDREAGIGNALGSVSRGYQIVCEGPLAVCNSPAVLITLLFSDLSSPLVEIEVNFPLLSNCFTLGKHEHSALFELMNLFPMVLPRILRIWLQRLIFLVRTVKLEGTFWILSS